MSRKLTTQRVAIMGLMIAMIIILWNLLAIESQFFKISFDFVPKMVIGMLFGPIWAGIGNVLADIIGNTMFAKSPFFIGFTLNKFIEGMIYGFFFYRQKVSWKNAILSLVTITLIINLALTPLWLTIMYNVSISSWVIWAPRLIKTAITLPLQILLVYMIGNALPLDYLFKKIKE